MSKKSNSSNETPNVMTVDVEKYGLKPFYTNNPKVLLLTTAVLFSVTSCMLVRCAPTTFHTVGVDVFYC
jgi:hypothetical protein